MGRSFKKALKAVENKNGKIKECESEMEKNQEKTLRKRKSFWSKCSSLFSRSIKLGRVTDSWRHIEQETQMSQMMVNSQSLDMERWGPEDSIDGNSQMLNIPIEPGRQVSTIILSPTKTGFKAVIAHYGIDGDLTRSLTKDLNTVSAQLENRRTLTLVFDMNSNTFDDVAVGRSESTLFESRRSESGKSGKSMSASALFVRTGVDDIVESAAFLQARLSLENPPVQSPAELREEKLVNPELRPVSCRSLQKSRVAFKTISEPLWQDKEKMRNEMVMKQNIQEVLNQFIFLDQDDSLMNYPRFCEEVSKKEAIFAEELMFCNESSALESLRNEEDIKTEHISISSKMSFSFDRLSQLTPSSARNVAPDLLVNIKPFKQHINNYAKIDYKSESHTSRKEKTGVPSKKPEKLGPPAPSTTIAEKTGKSKEISNRPEPKLAVPLSKSRLSVCLKCGAKAQAGRPKILKDKTSRVNKNSIIKKDGEDGSDRTCARQNSLEIIAEANGCTFCSSWKMYNKSCFESINYTSDSIEDLLKELGGYDHNSIFQRNISQFKRKINPNGSASDFKPSNSSLSFAEVIELDEGKFTLSKASRMSDNDQITTDFPKVTLRLIEFVRRTGDKTIQLERIKKTVEYMQSEVVMRPNSNRVVMENLALVCNFRASNHTIKVMGQKIEERISRSFANAGNTFVPQETMMIICPAYTELFPRTSIFRHFSDNKLEDFRGSISRRSCQIPDVISHLWMDKIDDLRNELISRMNETRICYDPTKYHSSHVITVKGKQKTASRCSVATTTSRILSLDGSSNAFANGLNGSSVCGTEKPEESELGERDTPISSADYFTEDSSNVIHNVYSNELAQEEGESKELHAEDLQSTGPNDQIISFTNPDFKIHSCLTFFVPFVQKIQTAVEILNSAMYSFPVRKVEDQTDKDSVGIVQSCTVVPETKKYFIDNELESFILKKCIEKNVVRGVTTSTTSKKEIMTIKGSKSGNHFLVTNKKVLTVNDKIKKSEVLSGGTQDESNEKSSREDKLNDILSQNVSEEMEDVNGVHCLYYKQTDGNETGGSSLMSNYCEGKVSPSGQSSVIAVSELEENPPPNELDQVNETKEASYEEFPVEDEMLNPNTANDSLQESDRGSPKQLESPMNVHSVNLLQKIPCETIDEGEGSSERARLVGEDEKCQIKTSVKAIQSSPCDSQIESVTYTKKLTVEETDENRVVVHEKVKESRERIRKIGEGETTQRLIAKRIGGKVMIFRGDKNSPPEKTGQTKRLSLTVTLTRHLPERKSSKLHGSDHRARGLIKTVEAKKSPDPNQKDISREGEPLKQKSSIRNRSGDRFHYSERKTNQHNSRESQNTKE